MMFELEAAAGKLPGGTNRIELESPPSPGGYLRIRDVWFVIDEVTETKIVVHQEDPA